MKSRKRIPSACRGLLFPAAFWVGVLLVPSILWAADEVPRQLISLEANKTPLGEVLSEIETLSGYSFSIDDQWKKVPVTVTLYETPFDQGLKRVLANLNNVIIYGSGNQIQIVILGQTEAGPSGRQPYQRPDYSRQQPVEPPEMEEPEPEPEEASPEENEDEQEAETETPDSASATETQAQTEKPGEEEESESDAEQGEGKGQEQGAPKSEGGENPGG